MKFASLEKKTWLVILLLGICFISIGCTDARFEPAHSVYDSFDTLVSNQMVGQSFVARFSGLEEIQVFLRPVSPGTGKIVLHLRNDALSNNDVRVAELPLSSITQPAFYPFAFEAVPQSNQQYFYVMIEFQGKGSVEVGHSSSIRTYLDGAYYRNQEPQQAQMAFHLGYEPSLLYLGLGKEFMKWGLLILAGILLLVFPGWALLHAFWPGWSEQDIEEKWIISACLGAGIIPLMMVWAKVIGWNAGGFAVWGVVFICSFYLLMAYGKIEWQKYKINHIRFRRIRPNQVNFSMIALIFIAIVLFWARFWTVRSLDAPMWGDSVQHTAITQLILNQGGLFDSWEPIAPYKTLSVHFGFSSLAAGLSWITGLSASKAVIWMGQIMNVLGVLSLYPLTRTISRGNRWAGISAVVVVGFFSNIPAVYVNWGRYAQLTGQVVLLAEIWLAIKLMEALHTKDWQVILTDKRFWVMQTIVGAGFAGMVLDYYRMPIYFGIFFLAWLACAGIISLWIKNSINLGFFVRSFIIFGQIGLSGLIFLSPWLPKLFNSNLSDLVQTSADAAAAANLAMQFLRVDYQDWLHLDWYLPPVLVIAAIGVWGFGILKKSYPIAALGFWTIFLAGTRALAIWHIPGAVMMDSFSVIIWLYVPVGLLIGWIFGWLLDANRWSSRIFIQMALCAGSVGASLAGAWQMGQIAQPEIFSLVSRPDVRAMSWIRDNTPTDALFLVQGFSKYDGTSAVGSDAGWWLPLLTGRRTNMPPQYALLNEIPEDKTYSAKVVALVKLLEENTLNSEESKKAICEWKFKYVYMGQGQGQVSYGNRPLFSRQDLEESPFLSLVYTQDGVMIYQVSNTVCNPG